jgi:hypothetical protein
MMPHVKTKEIADFSFLTPQHPDFDFRLPAYREDAQYRADPNMPEEFTAIDKMKLRMALTLAMHIVANGYQAMCNFLTYRAVDDEPKRSNLIFSYRVILSKKIVGILCSFMLIIFMLVVQIYALLEFGVFLVNVNFMFANIYTHAYATVLRLMYISIHYRIGQHLLPLLMRETNE